MKRVEVSLGLIEREGRYFLQRRDPCAEVLPGLWEFPGGKGEPGETPLHCLKRELEEELGWRPDRIWELGSLRGTDGEVERVFHLFRCAGSARFGTRLAWGWFEWAQILALPIPPLNLALLCLFDPDQAEGPPC